VAAHIVWLALLIGGGILALVKRRRSDVPFGT
jgi:hypothetical protein